MTDNIGTLLQHAGSQHRVGTGLVSAVEVAVTFEPEFPGAKPVYARLSNTKNHLEVTELLARLEGTESSAVFASGMAAMSAVALTVLKPGDHILCQANCYGGNKGFITKVLSRMGIESTFVPLDEWASHFRSNTKLAYFESISNPFCVPQDFLGAVELARSRNVLTLCDNTFASPIICRPADFGVDYVLESGTKYLNGHSDVVCGVVASSRKNIESISETAMYLGGFLATQSVSLLLRGLRTLHLRMEAHNKNGAEFARRLKQHPLVQDVFYGLQNGDFANIKKAFPKGFGGMCAVRFAPQVNVTKLLSELCYVADVPSLGGTETTACQPVTTTHWWASEQERAALGIDSQLVRFSVGLEEVAELVSELEQRLDCYK